MNFSEKLLAAQKKNNSLVCVGLDPDLEKLPKHLEKTPADVVRFCLAIIEATKDLVCAYKPQIAFFEAMGYEGVKALEQVIDAIPDDIPVILDAKRGDIGNTSAMYAKAAFEVMGVDAITVSPYLGRDSLEPFLKYQDKAIIILAKTSNPGAADFQEMMVDEMPLYEKVVTCALQWGSVEHIAFVVGATYPEHLARVRALAPDSVFLIPGVGAQGGKVEDVMKNGLRADGHGLVINSSRGIIFAGSGEDFDVRAREECEKLRGEINQYIIASGAKQSR